MRPEWWRGKQKSVASSGATGFAGSGLNFCFTGVYSCLLFRSRTLCGVRRTPRANPSAGLDRQLSEGIAAPVHHARFTGCRFRHSASFSHSSSSSFVNSLRSSGSESLFSPDKCCIAACSVCIMPTSLSFLVPRGKRFGKTFQREAFAEPLLTVTIGCVLTLCPSACPTHSSQQSSPFSPALTPRLAWTEDTDGPLRFAALSPPSF